jgi:tight adherence protein B
MFPDSVQQIAVVLLAMLATAGVAWVFIYPYLSGEAAASKRIDRISEGKGKRLAKGASVEFDLRKKSVESTLNELEKKQEKVEKNPPLSVRMEQAGLDWTLNTFIAISVGCGIAAFIVAMVTTFNIFVALLAAGVAAVGAPRWYLNFARKRRFSKFINEFPNALDVIVRGVKAGLPLVDCIRICGQESGEPVRSEFRRIMEAQSLNLPLGKAVELLYTRVPVPETNLFAIVITVQQKSGGNLSEILGNLSKVLRDRRKMKAKIRALAQEAVASASIIASLPAAVMGLLFVLNPDYVSLLWQKPMGQVMLGASAVWMSLGVVVMRRMINFDF